MIIKFMISTKIISKQIGISAGVRRYYRMPANAVSCDKVTGSSPAKGRFIIRTFRDEFNSIVGRNFRYKKDGIKTQIFKWFFYGNNIKKIYEVEKTNGKIAQEKIKVYNGNKTHGIELLEEVQNSHGDKYTFSLLQSGVKPQRVSCSPKWDGQAAELEYENTADRKFSAQNEEYLPIFFGQYSVNRDKQKVHHIAKINEKKYKLEGITPEPKISEGLITHDGIFMYGDCDPYTGQIRINSYILHDTPELVNTMAHEYKHASDFSDLCRLQSTYEQFMYGDLSSDVKEYVSFNSDADSFIKKSFARGIISDKSKKGKKLLKIDESMYIEANNPKIPHNNLYTEKRAIWEGLNEERKYLNLVKDFKNFFIRKNK